jgi:phosphoribosylformylglycinamidine synthase
VRTIHNIKYSNCPYFNLEEECKLQEIIKKLIKQNVLSSVHDISDGGMLACLLESSYVNETGFKIETEDNIRLDIALFGESQSRVIVSMTSENEQKVQDLLLNMTIPFTRLGNVTSGALTINKLNFGEIKDWKTSFENQLENIIEHNL